MEKEKESIRSLKSIKSIRSVDPCGAPYLRLPGAADGWNYMDRTSFEILGEINYKVSKIHRTTLIGSSSCREQNAPQGSTDLMDFIDLMDFKDFFPYQYHIYYN